MMIGMAAAPPAAAAAARGDAKITPTRETNCMRPSGPREESFGSVYGRGRRWPPGNGCDGGEGGVQAHPRTGMGFRGGSLPGHHPLGRVVGRPVLIITSAH